MKWLRAALRSPPIAGAFVGLLVFGALLGVRACGWLQRPELVVYDSFIRSRARHQKVNDPRIVICQMTEEDLARYGHPLDDGKLAVVLEKIVAAGPCVVGLDILRDLKEPRSGELYPQFADVLTRFGQIIAVERIPITKPPHVLAKHTDRVAPNNLPVDDQIDGLYRRAFLFLEERDKPGPKRKPPRQSLALMLAGIYLEAHGVDLQMVAGSEGDTPLLQLGRTVFPRLTPNAGGYHGLRIGGYEILMDFRTAPQFPRYDFGEILEDRLPAGALKDAIVIVCVTAHSVVDNNPTPIDKRLRGSTQHALIVSQLLRSAVNGDPPTHWWPEPAAIVWIAWWTSLGGACGLVFRSPWKLVPALALLVGAITLAGWEAMRHALWIPVATPALGALVSAACVTSLVVFLEHAERRVVQTLFSRHVSAKVADVLWVARDQFLEGGRLVPQRMTATLLFTDLQGYSSIAEYMDPVDLIDWINEYMNRIARQVDLHGGMVSSYGGDAIMAIFGAPVAHSREEDIDEDAFRAVECALAMRRELAALNISWAKRELETVSMRVGIFTGPVVAGSIGTAERLDYSVLGDSANIAARLESYGKELPKELRDETCTILIGAETKRRLRGKIATIWLGLRELKGKKEKVVIYLVDTSTESVSPL